MSFSASEFRTVVVGGGPGGGGRRVGEHISIDLVGWHLSSCLQTEEEKKSLFVTRHLSLQTGPPTVKRLFSQETTMVHYYEAICCVKTNDNYLHTAVISTWPASQV